MKIMLIFLGLLIILAGALPFLGKGGLNIIPDNVPVSAPGYYFIIISVGIIGLIYGVMNHMLFGTEKLVVIILGLMTILGGILPFIKNYISIQLPSSGPVYSGIIIIIGILGIIYGASKMN